MLLYLENTAPQLEVWDFGATRPRSLSRVSSRIYEDTACSQAWFLINFTSLCIKQDHTEPELGVAEVEDAGEVGELGVDEDDPVGGSGVVDD